MPPTNFLSGFEAAVALDFGDTGYIALDAHLRGPWRT